ANFQKLVAIDSAADPGTAEPASAGPLRESINMWAPPAEVLAEDEPADLKKVRKDHAPLRTLSYTSLLGGLAATRSGLELEAVAEDVDDAETEVVEDVLPGGRAVGRMLHEAIESLPLESLESRSFEDWSADPKTDEIFTTLARRHRLLDEPARARAKRIVFGALTLPLP